MTVAFRGSTKLEVEIELRAHLANLLRLENTALLLGAGASVSAGGRTVQALWDDFTKVSPEAVTWLEAHEFIDEQDGLGPVPNIEVLSDTLSIALAEWERGSDPRFESGFGTLQDLRRAVIRASILDESWWASPDLVTTDLGGLKVHREVLQKVISARQPGQPSPWIFTTNYDLAVEWAAESIEMSVVNGFTGVHCRRFSPQSFDLGFRNTMTRGEARFGAYNIYLAKLHGSLTWQERSGHYFEDQASSVWKSIKGFLDHDGTPFNGVVLPSAAKYFQTVGFALGEMFRRFAEFLARPQTCLMITGYGFGDEHINRLVRSALLNPTLQIVIYLPEFESFETSESLHPGVRSILALNNPRVTVVGGGAGAHFSAFAAHLPDPAIYDEDLRDLERRLTEQANAKKGDFDA